MRIERSESGRNTVGNLDIQIVVLPEKVAEKSRAAHIRFDEENSTRRPRQAMAQYNAVHVPEFQKAGSDGAPALF